MTDILRDEHGTLVPSRQFAANELRNRARLIELGGPVSESRAPAAATQSLGYQTPGRPMVSEWDAETAIKWAFYANVIAYRCVQVTAWAIAALPFRAGRSRPRRPTDPGDFDETAPLAQVLGPPPGGPAPKLTARRLWAWVIAQRMVTGRYGVEIEASSDGRIVALWPLTASHLKPTPSTGGTEWFERFEFGTGAQTRKLRNDQVWYGWDPSQNDFRQPESCFQAARLDLSIAVMMDRYNVGFLRNDARPAAVVVTEAFESDDAFRRFKSQWHGEYGGPDNANKIAFMEASESSTGDSALRVHQLGLSQRDARFIEQHKASLERVAMACGVPWSKLDASGRTFNNASEEDHNWWEGSLLPKLTDLQDEATMQIAPRLGAEVGWFDLSGVRALQPERLFTQVGVPSLLTSRVTTIDESREMLGLPALPNGEGARFLTDDEVAVLSGRAGVAPSPEPAVTVPPAAPIAPAPSAAAAAAAALGGEQRGYHTHLHTHNDGTVHEHEHSHRISNLDHGHFADVPHIHLHGERGMQLDAERVDVVLSELARLHPDRWGQVEQPRTMDVEERERRRREQWRAVDATVTTLEARWERALRKLFARQQRETLRRLNGKRGRQSIDTRSDPDAAAIFAADFWDEETRDVASDLYEAVTLQGFARMTALFGISFDVSDPYAEKFIQARAKQLAGQVTDTTYQSIKDALAAGVKAGEGIPEIAARVRHVFEVASTARAVRIARTEVISAYNGSSTLAAVELGPDIVGAQEWISTGDARTRPEHVDADGQIVDVGAPFDVGGEELSYPGDPSGSASNVVNCRCTIGFLTPDEIGRAALIETRVSVDVATAMLGLVSAGAPFDELAFRRALRASA